jgi:hypothetical protein
MPLPGARAEALAVQRGFEALNDSAGKAGNRVDVVSMIGPSEANWALVMEQLLDTPPFDVLHYAGHCFYNDKDPESSGWIFGNGNVLSTRELARVDHIPKLVFSNACESGVTPSRAELRSAALAPSFAEAFFARGAANFVCTAWPVDDGPARDFALRLYSGLLGLTTSPERIFKAMREPRRAIMKTRNGRNWGACQHYGNPFFQSCFTAFERVEYISWQSRQPSPSRRPLFRPFYSKPTFRSFSRPFKAHGCGNGSGPRFLAGALQSVLGHWE